MQSKLLIVEDSTTQAIALQVMLEERGFAVERAASAEEAIAILGREEFELVLSDIVMPGMSGYELCRHIKDDERLAATPVVLLTSLGDPLDIVRGLECGADNYVTKPYEPEYLSARIRHVLDRQRLRRIPKASLGVNVSFLGTTFSITSDKEQILDLFISSVEDVVRTNSALQESQRELAEAKARLEAYARTLAQEARASSDRTAMLMLEASDAILVFNAHGAIAEVNVRAGEMFGEAPEVLRGKPLSSLVSPSTRSRLNAQLERLDTTPRVMVKELEFTRADGRRFYCDFAASRTTNGSEPLTVVILHDVTDLKVTTARLRESEALLMDAQRFARLGSWERDALTGEVHWTPELFRILGLDATTVTPAMDALFGSVHQDDRERVSLALGDTIRAGSLFNQEFRVVHGNGAYRLAHGRAEAILEDGGLVRRVRGTVQDVTEQRQLEEQLNQSQKMEAVGQLAGGVAHDFNNLLTVITSYCGILLSDLPSGDPVRDDLQEINGAADRAAALTRQLLAFSRRQVLQPQPININELAVNLEKLLRRLIREDIEFVWDLDQTIGVVSADPGQLEQVLVNLVVNARDAMPEGGRLTLRTSSVERSAEMPVSGKVPPDVRCVLIEVSDTGTGMTPDVQARIFEPFFTTKPPGAGTGLGLSTVYGIVRQSGGDIGVYSTPGQGTTFRIELPCGSEGTTVALRPRAAAPVDASAGTILVVEDDPALRSVTSRILRKRGYHVFDASNGREALALCARHEGEIDLIITDLVMPEMSGYELSRKILESRPGTAVLFMSGYSHAVGLSEGFVSEQSAYLEKPFTMDGLAAKVREVLAGEA